MTDTTDLDAELENVYDPEIREAMKDLIKRGLVVDSGRRRNGRILWVARDQLGKVN